MEKKFDEKIKRDLMKDVEPLPVSYTEKIAALLRDLPDRNKEQVKKFNFRYAAVALLIFLAAASGAHAAVNMYQEYLSSMSRVEKERLNEKTQKETNDSDHFSRELSKGERRRIESLQKDYEEDGVFPQEKIVEVNQKEEVSEGGLVFCYENSTFYLPDEELTDEEILKIIDFWERRDYAVKEENGNKQISDKEQAVSREKAVEIAKETLQKAYKLDVGDADSSIEFNSAEISEKESMPSYFVSLSKDSWSYDTCVEVDAENGTIKQINISHKTEEECVSGIKVNEDKYKEYSEQIYYILSAMGKKDNGKKNGIEEMRLVYKYRKNGTLNRGNVKYLVKLKDGSAYVFLYSVNTKMVYHFYKVYDYSHVLMLEKRNVKLHKQRGILTKSKVLMQVNKPDKKDVDRKRNEIFEGVNESDRKTVTSKIKYYNLAMEHAYLWDNIFQKMRDPNNLHWNLLYEKGEVQIGWAFESGEEYDPKKTKLSENEYNKKFGQKVICYNDITADDFIQEIQNIQQVFENKAIRNDFETIIENMEQAKETRDVECLINVYRLLHDMDYYLFRDKGEIEEYLKDTSLIDKYYGVLEVYR